MSKLDHERITLICAKKLANGYYVFKLILDGAPVENYVYHWWIDDFVRNGYTFSYSGVMIDEAERVAAWLKAFTRDIENRNTFLAILDNKIKCSNCRFRFNCLTNNMQWYRRY